MCELPFHPDAWAESPCVQVEPASEASIGVGGAVFAQRPIAETVHPMRLPAPILFTDDNGETRAGIVVQAEPVNNQTGEVALGVVEPNGKNHVVLLRDGNVLEAPNGDWTTIAEQTFAAFEGDA